MSESWVKLLDQARDCNKSNVDGEIGELQVSLCSRFESVCQLIQAYLRMLQNAEQGEDGEKTGMPRATKVLIVDTRIALRFVLCLLGSGSASTIEKVQSAAIMRGIHKEISWLIAQQGCDTKIRITAAKTLCNIGTSNPAASSCILQDISWSPTCHEASKMMLKRLSLDDQKQTPLSNDASTWMEMIHAAGSSIERNALAAIAAALHNCIACKHDDDLYQIGKSIASDKLLCSNLMRYILPSSVIKPNGREESSSNKDVQTQDHSDDATEWIARLIESLSAIGILPFLYKSLGGSCPQDDRDTGITPEQLILLHCIGNSVEEYSRTLNTSLATGTNPLGGTSGDDDERILLTFEFLAKQWIAFRLDKMGRLEQHGGEEQYRYAGEEDCIENALILIIDIISGACIDDNNIALFSKVRHHLGTNTDLLQESLLELGLLVDRLGIENKGINARELKISDDDQRLVTSIVRLLGNVCFRCKENQDIIRNTNVPVPRINIPYVEEYTQFSSADDRSPANIRHGLHVLLSCTSFAYGCFTLREWAIVAIRNILDGNEMNQKEVEKLEAQQALQTPELKKLGVKVNLDKRGQVYVTPEGLPPPSFRST